MRVIILGKAPVAGQVKTRLLPEYTAEQAAAIHLKMMDTVLSKVCSIFDDVWLAADNVNHEAIKSLAEHFKVELCVQAGGNLGNRIQRLVTQSFMQDDKSVLLLGTDSPHVSTQRYQDVVHALLNHDVVIGPVEDGGYDLIAVQKNVLELFENISWGSAHVFDETMNIINALELSVKVLNMSFDLDRPEDLERSLPHTW
jgi:rSAM/selenodomain-associated transferase 1